MRRRNTITAVVFLLAVAAGFVLLLTSFFGGEGKFETLLKSFVRERDVMAFVDGAESAVNQDLDREHWFIQASPVSRFWSAVSSARASSRVW